MTDRGHILQLIEDAVKNTDHTAKVILFGSYARGDYHEESDIDLIILLDKEKITYEDRARITYPLFMVEIKTGVAITPLLYSKDFWENKHKVTPFYESVNEEGIVLA